MDNTKKTLLAAAVVALAFGGYKVLGNTNSVTTSERPESTQTPGAEPVAALPTPAPLPITQGEPPTPAPTTVAPAAAAKNVSTTIHYDEPSGGSDVKFTLTINKDGIVTDAATDILAVNGTAKRRQQSFAAGLPAVIKGKKLSTLSAIDRVGGSSLTTDAFNKGLAALKAQI